MGDSVDTKVLTVTPLQKWKKPPGRLRITWMKTFLNDLTSHKLMQCNVMMQLVWLKTGPFGGCWLTEALSTPVIQARNDDDGDKSVTTYPTQGVPSFSTLIFHDQKLYKSIICRH